MSKYCVILRCLLAAGVCAAVGVLELQAQQSDRAISFSSPKDASVNAALMQQLGREPDNQPIMDPFRAPEPAMPQSSLQGTVLRQNPQANQQQPALTARQRELLEKKKNWVFMDPEDMVPGMTAEEIFNLKSVNSLENPDENLSPMERYYQKQFEKKKPKDDDQQSKRADAKSIRDDDKNLRDKSATDALLGRITGQGQSIPSDAVMYVPKKDNGDDSSAGFNNPFSSANYGPDAPATAQQARMEVYKKLYGLTTDSDTAPTPAANAGNHSTSKPKTDTSTGSSFYTEKAAPPVLGFLAPTAPAAPGKPTMDTVVVKEDASTDKQNPLFISPSMKLPKRPFQ